MKIIKTFYVIIHHHQLKDELFHWGNHIMDSNDFYLSDKMNWSFKNTLDWMKERKSSNKLECLIVEKNSKDQYKIKKVITDNIEKLLLLK